jgi:hypothetical protein
MARDSEAVPQYLSAYAAALTTALATKDERERLEAARRVAQIGGELSHRRSYRKIKGITSMGELIADVLAERLEVPDEDSRAA